MKKVLGILGVILLASCSNVETETEVKALNSGRANTELLEEYINGGVYIYTIDDCEYIYIKRGSGASGLVHKENCNNCKKQR